ncbi:isopenicillin N synthase family dioxygenase [Corynebacterium glyciniphilum]|uniref:isopenicillin N synthase family dioxygenase n=1 Tax=Corynebacterium glyciniphilum TaxID=1404244 RepID=UPI003DA13219
MVQTTTPSSTDNYRNAELDLESRMGGVGTETTDRAVPVIDVNNWDLTDQEWDAKAEELWQAATTIGFFQLKNFGISKAEIEAAFAESRRLFALPKETLETVAKPKGKNVGFEHKSQIRPSTGTPDEKESYQLTRPLMDGLWLDEETLPGFRDNALSFESRCHDVAMRILEFFAVKLGFERDYFTKVHNPASDLHQCTLRMIHYMAVDAADNVPNEDGAPIWRAGAHTDFNCLTLLFQTDGESGLQVMPGADATQDVQSWTPVPAFTDILTCNIGDMLMRWSDDRLKSNFHRVKAADIGVDIPERYSMPYFAQADRDAVIEGPDRKYEPMTAGEYLDMRITANFSKAESAR